MFFSKKLFTRKDDGLGSEGVRAVGQDADGMVFDRGNDLGNARFPSTLSDNDNLMPGDAPEQRLALFLDIDGTLAPIAPRPEMAEIPETTLRMINALSLSLDGAVAIVSGRSLTDIDAMCAPYLLPAAALHGLELRFGGQYLVASASGKELLEPARAVIHGLVNAYPNLLIEDKGLSIALHYRAAPETESLVRRQMALLQQEQPEQLSLQEGKMVSEIRLAGGGKGAAIRRLMKDMPFQGRVPLFVGDDKTDEDGFEAVNALGGVSIRIGGGESCAQHRMQDVREFQGWLVRLVARLATQVSKTTPTEAPSL